MSKEALIKEIWEAIEYETNCVIGGIPGIRKLKGIEPYIISVFLNAGWVPPEDFEEDEIRLKIPWKERRRN